VVERAATEETGSSGVDDGGVESSNDLESFEIKSKTTRVGYYL
jgi:hypothetical protein